MDRGVKLTIHGNLVPELGMRGDVPLSWLLSFKDVWLNTRTDLLQLQ